MQRKCVGTLLLISFIGSCLYGCTPSFTTAIPDGPHRVGVRIENLTIDERAIRLVVWYPAQPEDGAEPHMFESMVLPFIVPGLKIPRPGGFSVHFYEKARAYKDYSAAFFNCCNQTRSKRSRFITLFHTAMKSCRNFSWESSHA